MSFKTEKVLVCGLCEKVVFIESDDFPEDLHNLLSKYCISQLYWICKLCEKRNAFKSSFGKNTHLEDDVNELKAKVENLESEIAEIKRRFNLESEKYDSGISGFLEESSSEADYANKCENSGFNFRNCKKMDSHHFIFKESQRGDSSSTSESDFFQTENSLHHSGSEDYPRSVSSLSSTISNVQEMESCLPLMLQNDRIADSCSASSRLDETSPKKKKEAHALIHHISNTKIKIDDKESTKSGNIVDVFLKNITPFLKKDSVFNTLYSRDYKTGSSYNNLRISAASEYDVDIVFKSPSEISLEVEFFEETTAYGKIKWQTLSDVPINKLNILKFFKKNSAHGYLQPLKISAWFQSLIDLFLQSNPKIDGIKKIKNRQSGPARTIEIVTDEDYILHIDLVPVFYFPYDVLEKTKIKQRLEKYPVNKDKQFWFLVPKQCQGEQQLLASDCKLSWRVDFPEVEKKVLYNKQSAKHVIRLLKLLRDKERWNIASYYIKTLILWRVSENPDCAYWQGNMLFERYLEAMKFLQECVNSQCLPFFMDPSYNLLHAFNKDECKNLSNRLLRIISSIEADHNNLNNIYS